MTNIIVITIVIATNTAGINSTNNTNHEPVKVKLVWPSEDPANRPENPGYHYVRPIFTGDGRRIR